MNFKLPGTLFNLHRTTTLQDFDALLLINSNIHIISKIQFNYTRSMRECIL